MQYPLTIPVTPNAYNLDRNSVNQINISPFTLQQQVLQGIGEGWELSLTFPPVPDYDKTKVMAMTAFVSSLRGVYGTFKFGPFPRDLSYTGTAAMTFASANNTLRNNITINNAGNTINAGTYIQIGTQLLHVLTVTNNGGTSTLDIFPMLREITSAGTAINHTSPTGLFRQKSSKAGHALQLDHTYTFTMAATEAIS